jgi:hypothetical protein
MQKPVQSICNSLACSIDHQYAIPESCLGLSSNVVALYTAAGNKNPAPGEYNVSLRVTHKRALAASLQGRESHGEQQQQQVQQQEQQMCNTSSCPRWQARQVLYCCLSPRQTTARTRSSMQSCKCCCADRTQQLLSVIVASTVLSPIKQHYTQICRASVMLFSCCCMDACFSRDACIPTAFLQTP